MIEITCHRCGFRMTLLRSIGDRIPIHSVPAGSKIRPVNRGRHYVCPGSMVRSKRLARNRTEGENEAKRTADHEGHRDRQRGL